MDNKILGYDVNMLASLIMNRDKEVRKNVMYASMQDQYIEETMSCDLGERKSWMVAYMATEIEFGKKTKNPDWRYGFMAAYDLLKGMENL